LLTILLTNLNLKIVEKIIIDENLTEQNNKIYNARNFCNAVNEVLLQFKENTGCPINLQEVKKAIDGDQYALHESLDSYLEKQLDEKKITGKLMRENFKAGANNIVNSFLLNIKKLSGIVGSDLFEHLSMENGILILSKEHEEIIRDSCRHYITSEKANEFFTKHKTAAAALTDLSVFIKNNTWISSTTVGNMADKLFSLDSQTGEVGINGIAYDRTLKN